jgi:hypothetical protein
MEADISVFVPLMSSSHTAQNGTHNMAGINDEIIIIGTPLNIVLWCKWRIPMCVLRSISG